MMAAGRVTAQWKRAEEEARAARAAVASEVAGVIAGQVELLVVEGDLMGGRARLAAALHAVSAAEARQDEVALRAALMDGAVAFATWVAALDYREPSELRATGPVTL